MELFRPNPGLISTSKLMLDVYSYKGSSTTISCRNISNSVCELNSTVNISCQI